MATKPRVYMDACCFIDMMKQEVGSLEAGREDDVWYGRKLLEANRAREINVYTSVLSMAEAVAPEKGQAKVPDDVKNLLRRILSSGQFVMLIQTTPAIGERARDLRWKEELVLKGADALHVASALELGCDEFITTNGQVQKLSATSALADIGLRVIRASQTNHLPDHYRQSDMLDDDKKN